MKKVRSRSRLTLWWAGIFAVIAALGFTFYIRTHQLHAAVSPATLCGNGIRNNDTLNEKSQRKTAAAITQYLGSLNLDIDGNGKSDALTDGLLIQRYLLKYSGSALTSGAIGAGATRSSPQEILTYLGLMRGAFDVDGDGQRQALSDGTLILRYLTGFRGSSLIGGEECDDGPSNGNTCSSCSKSCTIVANAPASPTGETQLLDQESGLCMDKSVWNYFHSTDSSIYNYLKTCTSCPPMPLPTIAIGDGKNAATLAVSLFGKPLLGWMTPALTQHSAIVNNEGNALSTSEGIGWSISINGTNRLSYLINTPGTYFQNRYESLNPGQTTSIDYSLAKKIGKYGSIYYFIEKNQMQMGQYISAQDFDAIVEKSSATAGLSTPKPYNIIITPFIIGGAWAADNGRYMGLNGYITVLDYSGEKFVRESKPKEFTQDFSHEYIHELQHELPLIPPYDASWWREGMADAVAIYNGFKSWGDCGFGNDIPPGCLTIDNADEPHNVGKCLFKHLDQEKYITSVFIDRLFHVTGTYPGLASCSSRFRDTDCVTDLNRLLTSLTGKDMMPFIHTYLQNLPLTGDPSVCEIGTECAPETQGSPCFTPPNTCTLSTKGKSCGTNGSMNYNCFSCPKGSFLDSSHHKCP